MTKDELLEGLRATARAVAKDYLSREDFLRHGPGTKAAKSRAIRRHFDSWVEACAVAGVRSGPRGAASLKPNPGFSRDECLAELRRVAELTQRRDLTRPLFLAHARFGERPLVRHFGSWIGALKAAGLDHKRSNEPVPLPELAAHFLRAAIDLNRIPGVSQVARRAGRKEETLSTRFGGYAQFKRQAIEHLLASGHPIPPELEASFRAALDTLTPGSPSHASLTRPAPLHLHGRTLGFRAFAYAPTYENEVVSLFASVAHELGFEILCNRSAFPDCEARRRLPGRRKRFARCLIEFELTSADFKRHGHPSDGCDLIVCWEHNWPDCPLPVLELKEVIRRLPGWV